ncbi:hypothetical protein [Hahella ganghwensis]|uniref:hypothetical protein n=1 Tax=Hahella ganghwensis TaxID=286420 RepID=UPI000381891E|nr:hypothetical protein [Hahella ganghwensis]
MSDQVETEKNVLSDPDKAVTTLKSEQSENDFLDEDLPFLDETFYGDEEPQQPADDDLEDFIEQEEVSLHQDSEEQITDQEMDDLAEQDENPSSSEGSLPDLEDLRAPIPDEDVPNSPIPNYIKFGLPALAIILIVVVAVLFTWLKGAIDGDRPEIAAVEDGPKAVATFKDNRHKNEPEVVEPDNEFVPASAQEPPDNLKVSRSNVAGSTVKLDLTKLGSNLNDFESRISSLDETTSGLAARSTEIEQKIAILQKAAGTAVMAELNARIETLTKENQSFRNKLLALRNLLETQQTKVKLTPPFKVLSVDIWGGDYSAAVMLNGQKQYLRNGDIIQNWTIDISTTRGVTGCIDQDGKPFCKFIPIDIAG